MKMEKTTFSADGMKLAKSNRAFMIQILDAISFYVVV